MAKSPQIIMNNNNNNNTASSTIWSLSSLTWGIRSSFQLLTIILISLVFVLYFTQHDSGSSMPSLSPLSSPPLSSVEQHRRHDEVAARDTLEEKVQIQQKCDYFSGKWVFDDTQNYPLYKEKDCSFMSDQLACQKFGRKDLSFQHWRWQPHHCHLPRFNATRLLEKLRNKRLVYVGDSLNRNQWISMICMVETNIHPSLKSMQTNGSLSIFKAIEYNATIEFYWAPLLVESNSDDPVKHRQPERIVRAQSIEKHAKYWTDADYLIFDTYLWWKRPFMKLLWGSFESSEGIYKDVKMLKGYEMALRTWSDWLEIHVNHSKTHIFWMSMSPTHQRSEEWGGASNQNCYNETQLIKKQDYWGSGSDPNMMKLVEATIENISKKGLNIQLLNITQLSEYRKEGHPSIHRKQWEPLTPELLSNPTQYADCIHWCLPGIPDTWNEILYAYIF